MKLVHTMIGTFSYMRYSYHGDFMIPTGVAEYSTPVNRDLKDLDQTYEKAKKGQKTSIF